MRVELDRKDLLEAVNKASRAVSNRATLPVLSGIRITANGKLEVAATDLELTVDAGVPCSTTVDGSAIVPSKLFRDMVKSAQGERVELIAGDGELEMHAGRSLHRVKTMAADDYPVLPGEAPAPTDEITVSALELETVLGQVGIAASRDETRQVLTGVLFELKDGVLTIAATDSYRLAVLEGVRFEGLPGNHSVIVPGRACREVVKLAKRRATVRIGFREDLVTFTIGADVVRSRLIEGQFPNFRQLLPDNYPNKLTVNRAAMLETLKRVGLMAQNNLPVKLTLGGAGFGLYGVAGAVVEISAHTPDVGEAAEVLEGTYDGEAQVIAFSPQYFADGLNALEGDDVTLHMADGLKPATLTGSDGRYTYLLMPVRLS